MATIIGRLIKPTAIRSGFSYLSTIKNAHLNVHQYTRLMTTASNYHYHEKPAKHAHDKLWKAERYLSLGLLGVLPAAAVIPHPVMDYAVALSLIVHIHWGIEAIVVDYVRPSIVGPVVPKISVALVYILSSLALGGLFMFNYTDVGITQAVRMLAKI